MDIVIPENVQHLYENKQGSEITKYPHPILRQKAVEIIRYNPELQRLVDRMLDNLHGGNGVGLAAPQIGVSKRIIIFMPPEESPKVVVNPVLSDLSKETEVGLEGCLSIPSVYGDVERSLRVVLTGFNRRGKTVRYELEGFPARIVQHEVDHLDGILFIDKVDPSTLHWSLPDEDEEEEAILVEARR